MSAVEGWLGARRPPPPGALAERLAADGRTDRRDVSGALTERACEALDRACAAPGPVRDSAFHLLVADALLTYACEAALETGEPASALDRILRRAAAVDR